MAKKYRFAIAGANDQMDRGPMPSRSRFAKTVGVLAIACVMASSEARTAERGGGLNCPARAHPTVPSPKVLSFAVFDAGGKRILVAAGNIHEGDGDRLRRFLLSAGRIDEIWFDSVGGNAEEGIHIGKAIRERKLATRVPVGFECISSCSFAFMGGIIRRIEYGALYGVHAFYLEGFADRIYNIIREHQLDPKKKYTKAEIEAAVMARDRAIRKFLHQRERRGAELAAKQQRYVQEMGISRRFLIEQVFPQQSLDHEADEILTGLSDDEILAKTATFRCPTPAQLVEYNIINTE